jgi:DNA helicase-2/ATP-dependent DNA helicase PcrA
MDAEGQAVADKIQALLADGEYQPRDIFVLYRTNAQSRSPEEGLLANRIPYQIIGGVNFYQRREVRDLLAYLRLAEGRGELDDVTRCINSPFRYLGKAFVDRVREAAKDARARARKEGKRVSYPHLIRLICKETGLQQRQRYSAEDWADLIESTHAAINHETAPTPPAAILEKIVQTTQYTQWLTQTTQYTQWLTRDEGEESTENSRVSNVRELIRAASKFPTTAELLDYIDKTLAASQSQRRKNAKGMERKVVFLIGANEGILPHARCEDVEEERRLFYVACTRAMEQLHISCVYGAALGNRVLYLDPSRFLQEGGLTVGNDGLDLGDPHDV